MHFSGKISTIVFEKRQQGFYILKMLLDGKEVKAGEVGSSLVTIKGYVPGLNLKIGSWFGWEGTWVEDPKYGRQIAISKAPVFKGKVDPETVVGLLIGNGVSEMVAYQLRSRFGVELSEALKDVERVQDSLEISNLEAEFLATCWKGILQKMKALESLNNLNLPKAKVGEIWATFGDATEEILASNPWALIAIEGIPFQNLDELGRSAGLDMACLDRCMAAVRYSVRTGRQHGDLYMTTNQLLQTVNKTAADLSLAQIAEAVGVTHREGSITLDAETREGVTAVYDPWFYSLEEEAAKALFYRKKNAALSRDDFTIFSGVGPLTAAVVEEGGTSSAIAESAVNEVANQVGITLSLEQFQGIYDALLYPISVLTGLPGTGKSTSMRVLTQIFKAAQLPVLLVAPTGIAAKRLGSVCHMPAFTIHRALGAKGGDEDLSNKRETTYAGIIGESKGVVAGTEGRDGVWGCNEKNPHPAQVVIVDEFSMVDQHLIYRLLQGTSVTSRLICVGDAAQLPSVGPGNVLRDLINSSKLPVTSLSQIYRQEDTSDIITAAHAIYRGEVPGTGRDTDFVLLPVPEEEQVLQVIVRLAVKFYNLTVDWKGEGSPPSFQVLSPRHMGTVGVTNLNANLRRAINPPNESLHEIKMGKEDVREGDRVMVVKNNYDLNVFNGDVGKIIQIDRRSKEVRVKIHGSPSMVITFPIREAYTHLRLAYACTVHKYQGLEVDSIIMPIVSSFRRQLQRNLLYTAITRAKKKVILVGSTEALAKAVANNKEDERNTLFVDRLCKAFASEANI